MSKKKGSSEVIQPFCWFKSGADTWGVFEEIYFKIKYSTFRGRGMLV